MGKERRRVIRMDLVLFLMLVITFVPLAWWLFDGLFNRKLPAVTEKDWDEYYENEKALGHRISQIGQEHLAKKNDEEEA